MGATVWLILKLAGQLAWPYVAPFLFELLSRWFGKGLMEFVYEIIGENAEKIITEKMTRSEAASHTSKMIVEATRNSPDGINETWANIIAHVGYMKWVADNIPVKYERWIDGLILWQGRAKYVDRNDLMVWYLSRPDVIKK